MPGEWTWGSINALLAYITPDTNSPMPRNNIHDATTDIEGFVDGEYNHIVTVYPDNKDRRTLGYLYANRRAMIPFGWFSNAMPATASTDWAVLVQSCYDPFVIGGGQVARSQACLAYVKPGNSTSLRSQRSRLKALRPATIPGTQQNKYSA
jgi:hypothetical protein